ncbi:hypothetical protein GQR60_14615 [Labilibaculum sp. A4]|nr:hypothetical protein [Labilibaculum euxinus]MDQ1770216.1 hypothetical protein [Labilibaculum euxinus]MWN77570.1 hypothetical protein [Labilibaculum euxinus]
MKSGLGEAPIYYNKIKNNLSLRGSTACPDDSGTRQSVNKKAKLPKPDSV